MGTNLDRRAFLKSAAALAAAGAMPGAYGAVAGRELIPSPRKKAPGVVRGAFFYPPLSVVEAGELEDSWAKHQWCTWPGNQFRPEEQQAKFMEQLRAMTAGLDLTLEIDEAPIYTDAGIQAFFEGAKQSKPDALLLFHFWNSFSGKLWPYIEAFDAPVILYHPVGANHQLPPEKFRTAPGVQYIHSVENWAALERGLRSVHAQVRMGQSRLLRVSGRLKEEADDHESFFDMPIHGVPAGHFNDLFDAIAIDKDMERFARSVRRKARHVMDLSDQAFLDAVRSHVAVLEIMERHEADAITIECLFLKHRKPCLSFSVNNGALVPCGCENDLNATLTLMLGANLFGCGGFQHNPEYDIQQNLYFGSHCTCATRLHGPDEKAQPYLLRPFFHQLPKTVAFDVQWPAGEPVTLCKYHTSKEPGEQLLDAYAGELVSSPGCPPTGGCATRALVRLRDVDDVCTVYPGPHPSLFCGDHAQQVKTFADLYRLKIRTNA
ncbi:MAG: hypothetical protein JXR94_21590 [Candidatus Hydrogenedentes bacterium]|nr:hypothetical protein [Candidatus Hydrogenedentota bacterium]